MDLNIKQLEYFCAVAEEKSISKAARKLHVAQPPISRQLALLEDELGVCLFLRNNKGIELTQAGRSLYQQSQHMFQNLRMMVESVRDINEGVRGLLKIGIIYSNIPVVMDHLKEYHKKFPLVELYIRLGSPKDLLDDMSRGDLHVLFLRSPTDDISNYCERVLGEDPLELVMCRKMDPAPGLDSIPIEALKGVPMCLLRSDDMWGYGTHLVNECHRKGFTPNVVCQCYDTPMAMQLVQAEFGISYLPRSIVETHLNSNIYSKPIKGVPGKSYPTMCWSSNIYYANCVKQFISTFDPISDGHAQINNSF